MLQLRPNAAKLINKKKRRRKKGASISEQLCAVKSADPWLCLCPSRWPGGLPGPWLLPAVSLSEQPALPRVPGPPRHHSAGPDRLTRSEVLLWPHQAPGRQRQHPHHSWRQPFQQQVGALCPCRWLRSLLPFLSKQEAVLLTLLWDLTLCSSEPARDPC